MDEPPGETAPQPRVADTSCLYAFFNEEDEHHAKARHKVSLPGPLVIPGEVLVETIGLITGKVGRAAATAAQSYLVRLPHAEFSHETDLHAVLAIVKDHPALSIPDATVIWHCRRLPARAATFDARLRRLARKA